MKLKIMAMARFMAFLVAIWAVEAAHVVAGGYRVVSVRENPNGFKENDFVAVLEIVEKSAAYGPDIEHLLITVSCETDDRLHLHITDANQSRWEVPYSLIPRRNGSNLTGSTKCTTFFKNEETKLQSIVSPKLQLSYTVNPFSFTVTRTSDGEVIFDSPASSRFVFKNQYLEISTRIPKDASLYGLGESTRIAGFRLVRNSTYTLWTADTGASNTDINLYGSHPFYLDVRRGGRAHGVLLLNSNGMDIIFQGDYLTYRVIGGVFDFYFFAGPSPISVVQQYTEVVGRPAAMPYWSLGFHQCRWGYKNVTELKAVVAGYKNANLPLEVMWTDIDHMDVYKDFTLDPVNFPLVQMQAFVDQLHANDQRYVLIVDPGIKPDKEYATYKRAKAANIFIKDLHGKPYLGQVWPGPVHFPDFLHPKTESFWTTEISIFHKFLAFDGLWIDMNEASNFCTGTSCSFPANVTCPSPDAFTQCCLVCNDDQATEWDRPPYAINNAASHRSLGVKTIPVTATHFNGILEYNAHNLYGLSEAVVTNKVLKRVLKKRPFVLSRSSFVGSGSVTAHWTGDNAATWNDLKYSIVSILNSGLAGIPMVGADICGFGGDTTEELCSRWIQLGAFYPFSRDHNDLVSRPQELFVWNSVTQSARKALGLRYQLLPYLYTLLFEAHTVGSPVARPLFFSFPSDTTALTIDKQFLLGRGVLVSPVLTPNTTSVKAYFPEGTWYNLFDYSKLVTTAPGSDEVLEAPWDTINVHVHQGSIIPMQDAAVTTTLARKTPFTLLVAFSMGAKNAVESATGELFIDDGEALEMQVEAGRSSHVKFTATAGGEGKVVSLNASVLHGEFASKQRLILQNLVVLGVNSAPRYLVINGKEAASSLKTKVFKTGVQMSGLALPLAKDFSISFKH